MFDLPKQPFGMRRAVSTLCGPTRRQVRLAKRNTRCSDLNAQDGAASGLHVMIAKRRRGKACTCGLLLAFSRNHRGSECETRNTAALLRSSTKVADVIEIFIALIDLGGGWQKCE